MAYIYQKFPVKLLLKSIICIFKISIPGEEFFRVMLKKNLRKSRDWFGSQWVEIGAKPDILSVISAVSPGTKLSACTMAIKSAESGGSEISAREPLGSEQELDGNKRSVTSMADDDDLKSRKRSCPEDEDVQGGLADGGDADGVTNCNDDGGYTELVMKNEGLVAAGQACGVAVAS